MHLESCLPKTAFEGGRPRSLALAANLFRVGVGWQWGGRAVYGERST